MFVVVVVVVVVAILNQSFLDHTKSKYCRQVLTKNNEIMLFGVKTMRWPLTLIVL